MVELIFAPGNTGNNKGITSVIINSDETQSVLGCEISSGNNQLETLELTIDQNGYFAVTIETQPINLLVDGNLLTEAEDFNDLKPLEYIWNPVSKILTGRVPV